MKNTRMILVLILTVWMFGCGAAPHKEFVDATYLYATAFVEPYCHYVEQDTALNATDIAIRTKAAKEFFKMAEEEYERQQPGK